MNTTVHSTDFGLRMALRRFARGVLLLASFFAVAQAIAAGCFLAAPHVPTAPTIDGTVGAAEWSGASITESGTGCFSQFHDGSVASPILKTVTVYAMENGGNIYLAFHVDDSTGNPGTLARGFGERIYVEYGQGTSGTTGATRLIITNTRGNVWPNPLALTDYQSQNGNGTAWANTVNRPTAGEVAITNSPNGYEMELKISSCSPCNLAFAIINDLGTTDPTTHNADAFEAHFPSALTIDTVLVGTANEVSDPANPVGSAGWKQQQNWAVASNTSPADIVITPDPTYHWLSDDIDVLNCDDPDTLTGDKYTYYAANPCAFKVKVWLTNTGVADFRSILVVVSNTGTGQLKWQVVDFKEAVPVPAGTIASKTRTPVLVTVNRLPQMGIMTPGHPCVRVYVLPASLDQATRTKLTNANTNAALLDQMTDLDALVAAYGLDVSLGGVGKQVAQQNISIATTAPVCPTTCTITELRPEFRLAAARSGSYLPAALTMAAGSEFDRLAALSWSDITARGTAGEANKGVLARLNERYGKDHVVVFVTAFAYDTNPGVPPPAYRIIHPIGGVTQLFPVTMLRPGEPIPVRFVVGNPTSRERTVILKAEVFYPPGYGQGGPTTVSVPPVTLAPGQTKQVDQIDVPSPKRLAVFVALGGAFPNGSFSNTNKSGFAGNLGLEYGLTPTVSIEGTLGWHRLGGKNAAPDVDVTQFGVNGKWYFVQPAWRPFVTLGAGVYASSPGSTRFGGYAGVGVQIDLAPQWSLEGRYTYNGIANNSPNSGYSLLLVGLRYAF